MVVTAQGEIDALDLLAQFLIVGDSHMSECDN
jgi:hypothetical protein